MKGITDITDFIKEHAINPAVEKPINVVDMRALLMHSFPKREPILNPVFNLASLNMIFSRRGVGKTHAGLGIAYAAASGGAFWVWTATRPFKTLFIDGEMPGEALQARLAAIVTANEKEPPEDYFKIITIDMNDGMMPDLSCLDGQIQIEDACLDAELIILDNLSCLCRSGRENEGESWHSIGEWALRMRSLGKCVIYIHHAGKDGNQRGTSKREDVLDVVVELKRPQDYEPEQGARFVVSFTKSRHLSGNEAKSFEAMLSDINGLQTWTTKPVSESTYEQVIELSKLGLNNHDMATELGINKSNVLRALQEAVANGRIIDYVKEKPGRKPKPRVDFDD